MTAMLCQLDFNRLAVVFVTSGAGLAGVVSMPCGVGIADVVLVTSGAGLAGVVSMPCGVWIADVVLVTPGAGLAGVVFLPSGAICHTALLNGWS